MITYLSQYSQLVSALGAIGSIAGAWIAWLQYKKATRSALRAESSESRLLRILHRNELSKDSQKIREYVERLSKHVRRGQTSVGAAGLNLNEDIEKLIVFTNQMASTAKYSNRFKWHLDTLMDISTSIDFSEAQEEERITSIRSIIEKLNEIAVTLDHEVSKDD